nr:DUF4145 domain-containing protein [uncultured Methanoregula sp.]
MLCPFCSVGFNLKQSSTRIPLTKDSSGYWGLEQRICPECGKMNLVLFYNEHQLGPTTEKIIHPRENSRAPCPKEVPLEYAEDFNEASLILNDSPKASAALSRRCLQNILRHCANVSPKNLSKEIQEILDTGNLPSHLSQSLDAIRIIGNFAAHPMKSESSGEILSVEPGEAEWCLDVIEGLFDYYFVQPSLIAKKKETLNIKLAEAGKTPIK